MEDRNVSFKGFCKLLGNEEVLEKSTASIVNKVFKLHLEEIKSEVLSELLSLEESKKNDYLDLLINEVQRQNYHKNLDVSHVQRFLDEYKVSIEDVIEDDYNKNFREVFSCHFDYDDYSPESQKIKIVQTRFLEYFCSYYANELINYLNSRKDPDKINKSMVNKDNDISNKIEKQMTVNQAVILLDKLGVFTTNELENKPNTKKAKLISLLIGKNEKNIKTAIENLEKKPLDLGNNFQKDLDKVEELLNNLE